MAAALVVLLKRKGGVGSSTLAANLAGAFHARGWRVRVLDCDAQHSLAAWASWGEAAQSDAAGCLATAVEVVETDSPAAFRGLVARARESADLVVVDAAPGFPVTALEAARHADLVLIPAGPSPLDLAPAADALEVAESCRDGRARPLVRFVPSRNLPRTRLGRDLPETLAGLGAPVLPGISQRVAVAESVLLGLAVCEYAPDSDAAREFAALADAVAGLLPAREG